MKNLFWVWVLLFAQAATAHAGELTLLPRQEFPEVVLALAVTLPPAKRESALTRALLGELIIQPGARGQGDPLADVVARGAQADLIPHAQGWVLVVSGPSQWQEPMSEALVAMAQTKLNATTRALARAKAQTLARLALNRMPLQNGADDEDVTVTTLSVAQLEKARQRLFAQAQMYLVVEGRFEAKDLKALFPSTNGKKIPTPYRIEQPSRKDLGQRGECVLPLPEGHLVDVLVLEALADALTTLLGDVGIHQIQVVQERAHTRLVFQGQPGQPLKMKMLSKRLMALGLQNKVPAEFVQALKGAKARLALDEAALGVTARRKAHQALLLQGDPAVTGDASLLWTSLRLWLSPFLLSNGGSASFGTLASAPLAR